MEYLKGLLDLANRAAEADQIARERNADLRGASYSAQRDETLKRSIKKLNNVLNSRYRYQPRCTCDGKLKNG